LVEINIASIRRLTKKSGVPKVSLDALEYLLSVTEHLIMILAKKAHEISTESGRKMLEVSDIVKAIRILGLDRILEEEMN